MEQSHDYQTVEELVQREAELSDQLERTQAEVGTAMLTPEQQTRWDETVAERENIRARIVQVRARQSQIGASTARETERPFNPQPFQATRTHMEDIFDLSTVRGSLDDPAAARRQLRDRAMIAVERATYPDVGRKASKEDMQSRVAHLLDAVDDDDATLARRILITGNPAYEGAFWKKVMGRNDLSTQENSLIERAGLLQATAGYAMPYTLDPTVLLTSNGNVNPLRQIARVVTITGKTWNGVNSAGITAGYAAEQAEASDGAPTLTQPTVDVLKAHAFVPYSLEAENWSDIRGELTTELLDAKDNLEATKFTLGTGTPEPQGFTVGATNLATTAATATIALADLDTLADCLPPRFQSNAVWVANRAFYSKVRQLDRAAGVDVWAPERMGFPNSLLGVPRYEVSDMVATTTTSASLIAGYGDFNKGYLIVDRVGASVEQIPHLFGTTNNYPSGERGIYMWFMNNGIVRSTAPLRLLKIL